MTARTIDSYIYSFEKPKKPQERWGCLRADVAPNTERICSELHRELCKLEKYEVPSETDGRGAFKFGDVDVPKNGMYFFFQKGEEGHNGDRIVRVGINKTKKLALRMSNHFRLDPLRSVFSTYLIHIYILYLMGPKLDEWTGTCNPNKIFDANRFDELYRVNKKPSDLEKDLKILRSRMYKGNTDRLEGYRKALLPYFRENFRYSFVWFPDELEERDLMEDGIIGTVAHCNKCGPSSTWIGKLAPHKATREYGLWLRNCTSGRKRLSEDGKLKMVEYIEKTRDHDY